MPADERAALVCLSIYMFVNVVLMNRLLQPQTKVIFPHVLYLAVNMHDLRATQSSPNNKLNTSNIFTFNIYVKLVSQLEKKRGHISFIFNIKLKKTCGNANEINERKIVEDWHVCIF